MNNFFIKIEVFHWNKLGFSSVKSFPDSTLIFKAFMLLLRHAL